jgi:hypothetical protein
MPPKPSVFMSGSPEMKELMLIIAVEIDHGGSQGRERRHQLRDNLGIGQNAAEHDQVATKATSKFRDRQDMTG